MLALTMLLSAAAGVNAIIGGEIKAVELETGEFFCAENCVNGGFYYSQAGYACPVGELVRKVDANGNGHKYFPFDCADAKLGKGWAGWTVRPLRDEDKVKECGVFKSSGTEEDICISYKTIGGGNKIVKLSEVEEMAKSATASATEKNKPAPPKSRQECLKIGQ
ncbi:hypothetical protein MAJ_05475, partial [Metarhizium majus ARSEF 297]